MAQAHANQDAIQRGEIQPPAGLNYMEEQYVKYGRNLGNYHPAPIVGTNIVQGITDNMTPEEYNKFFNHQRPQGGNGDRKMTKRYKAKGIDYKMYGDRYHKGSVLEDKEKLVENSTMSGITSANQIRNTNRPDLNANEGNFSNTFLSSG
jgi:hypothetical protein